MRLLLARSPWSPNWCRRSPTALPVAHRWVLHVAAAAAVLAAVALGWPGGRARAAGPVASPWRAIWSLRSPSSGRDPAPRIDVWVSLQQASDGLAHGAERLRDDLARLPRRARRVHLPAVDTVLLAPGAGSPATSAGRWSSGPSWRVAAVLALGPLALAAGRAGGRRRCSCCAPAPRPRSSRPGPSRSLLALLACWALLVSRGRAWWAVLPLALALASKQHMVLLLPLLAVWPAFGWRRTAVAPVALAGLLVLPWFLAAPAAMWHDTVTLLVGFHPILFADTLYLAALHELGLSRRSG